MEKMKLKNKKEVDIKELSNKLLEYAIENFSESKVFDTYRAKKDFGVKRNLIIEAYAFGPSELHEFKLIESKPATIIKEAELPVIGRKGTVVIKKFFLDQFNIKNPDKAYEENDQFDIKISADKIVLTRKN
ncbi:hypothetical protein H4684_002777 [Desulfomicrobium macestii]|uniref:Uncharacterized protein n=1 Tax=Desulfomicrobium macestii TaxID=90731 RepID=A0ABR9H5Y5_9BACT|nr:hypothetical protein [Desulfomicrobium macestii]MBE1426116.1 hypothetical protein [Desulfomicrobium macestii]